MVNIHYSPKGTPYVWASDLHAHLEIDSPLSEWFSHILGYGFVLNEDYSYHPKQIALPDGDYNEKKEWAVQLDMAKHIAMIQRTDKGKALRDYLLRLDSEVNEGARLNHLQISALFDLCKVMGFFSVQKMLQSEHFEFMERPKNWWDYRAKLFGYSKKQLQDMMQAIGKKYTSERQALLHLKKHELIRQATIDLFIAMGKSTIYAKNMGSFMETIAKELKPEIYNDNGLLIDFKSPSQIKTISLLKNKNDRAKLLGSLA
ncbi:antA/AntB antirepressor family protein [Pontibacter sp. JH31]|uniref:AntA/AntB antirepressor family protein n=1 Tax=Pontibacter aquaedesilientis TaxID=2766980 RepID=A0ABR7XJ37_9BACT|nr:antA/AntB antirepressor family protein [Pontibacter aquaedesilientis]MBD1398295.1 antA/AntB antirepressor family protein [Pontibacter aquaedesilientis]